MNENLAWHFPIQGITESRTLDITEVFKVRSRNKILRREMKLQLQGLADYTEGEEFKLEFGDLPEK